MASRRGSLGRSCLNPHSRLFPTTITSTLLALGNSQPLRRLAVIQPAFRMGKIIAHAGLLDQFRCRRSVERKAYKCFRTYAYTVPDIGRNGYCPRHNINARSSNRPRLPPAILIDFEKRTATNADRALPTVWMPLIGELSPAMQSEHPTGIDPIRKRFTEEIPGQGFPCLRQTAGTLKLLNDSGEYWGQLH
jgi:hypothetical protein